MLTGPPPKFHGTRDILKFLAEPNVDVHFEVEQHLREGELIAYRLFGSGRILIPVEGGPPVDYLLPLCGYENGAPQCDVEVGVPKTSGGSLLRAFALSPDRVMNPQEASHLNPPYVSQSIASQLLTLIGMSGRAIGFEYEILYSCTGIMRTAGDQIIERWGEQILRI